MTPRPLRRIVRHVRHDNHRASHTAKFVRLVRKGPLPHRGPLPRQQPPTPIEREYAAAIVKLVIPKVRQAVAPLLAELPRLMASALRDRDAALRHDAGEGRRIRELMAQARAELADSITPSELEALARSFAARTAAYNATQLSKQIKSALGADVFTQDRALKPLTEAFVDANVGLIKNIGDQLADNIEATTMRAIQDGQLHGDLADELEGQFGFSEDRAALIARDQIGKAYGQINASRQREMGVTQFIWRTVEDERVRSEHEDRNGETYDYSDPPDGELPGEPINCFPGDTRVSSQSPVDVVYRRRYRGEGTVLETDNGCVLKSTPNHPVLTARGWVPAQNVQVGDYVVEAPSEGLDIPVSNREHRESTFKEVFDALEPLGGFERCHGLRGGFHSDGTDQQIDIVHVHRNLGLERNLKLSQPFRNQFLARAYDPSSRVRGFDLLFGRAHPSADRIVRAGGQLLALLLGRDAHALAHRGRTVARLNALTDELGSNGCARDSELFRDALNAAPFGMETANQMARVVFRIVRRTLDETAGLNTPSAEELAEMVRANADRSRGLGERVVIHQFRRVVQKSRCDFSVHVYTFQTAAGWYVAQDLIVKNCRCYAEPVFDDILDASE